MGPRPWMPARLLAARAAGFLTAYDVVSFASSGSAMDCRSKRCEPNAHCAEQYGRASNPQLKTRLRETRATAPWLAFTMLYQGSIGYDHILR